MPVPDEPHFLFHGKLRQCKPDFLFNVMHLFYLHPVYLPIPHRFL